MRRSKKTPLVVVSTSVDQETIEKIKAVAAAMKVTRSTLVRQMIADALAEIQFEGRAEQVDP